MTSRIASLIAFTALTFPALAIAADSTGIARDIDTYVTAEMQREQVPGAAVAVVRKGEVLVAKGYGFANVELGVPVTADTIFQSGSLGKAFTAVLVMLLVEDGKLSLDDPLRKYLPEAPAAWSAITLRHLLNHTSGIKDYGEKDVDYRRDYTDDQLAGALYKLPLEFPVGSRWSYSNSGYVLLGFVVRKASGRFYGDVLRERVFGPLGMKTARVISEADIVPHRAAGYRLHEGALKNQDWVSPSLNTTADGALYVSLQDMLAWDRGLRRGAILRPESWAVIRAAAKLTNGKTHPYGMGWFVGTSRNLPWQFHSGSWQGFKTYMSRHDADQTTVIFLGNLAEADGTRLVNGITAIVDPTLAQIVPEH